MKRNLSTLILFAITVVMITSCGKNDACDDCPVGTECIGGECVMVDPCAAVTCDPGQECINGDCQDINTNCNQVQVTGTISANTTWTNDNIYILNGKVDVAANVTLTINAGTIIKGAEGIEQNASALVVARGAKLIAEGTADMPIIFTSVLDDISCGMKTGTTLKEYDFGKWGGVIVLGKATVSTADGDTEGQIEGIPGNVAYGKYGGNVDNDNSGIIKYVSIRHGGALIGDGNEINGLTLGGVGNGTLIENIEIVGNLDDGIEFFGGTVNVKNAIVGYQGDDAIDIDQNYSGTVDNFYVIHGGDDTDEGLEIDGPEGTAKDGFFTLKNGTLVAADQAKTSPGDFKSKSQGFLEGIHFKGYSRPIKVRVSVNADCSDRSDSWTYVRDGRLTFTNTSIDGNFTNASALNAYLNISDDDPDKAAKEACFNNNLTTYEAVLDAVFGFNGNNAGGAGNGGADLSAFQNWSWLAINNKIN